MEAFNRRDGKCSGESRQPRIARVVPVRAALEEPSTAAPDAGEQYCAAVEQSWQHMSGNSNRSTTAATGFWPLDTFEAEDAIPALLSMSAPDGSPAFATAGSRCSMSYPDRADALDAVGLAAVGDVAGEPGRSCVASWWATWKPRSRYADPDIVWNPVEESAAQGLDAVRASLARWKSAWEEYETVHEEFLDIGDRVLVTLRMRGRGRGSGVEVEARLYGVYTLLDGLIVRMDEFSDKVRSPRIRRATGVGDVAGERAGC